jgi:hypothetical protein
MNINPDFQSDSELDAETAMATCMAGISDTLIEPAMEKGELDETDQELLAVIGTTLKIIAEKAKAYEELCNQSDKKNHFRN